MKFVKENKSIVFAMAVIVLSFILLAIPGFARYGIIANEFQYKLSGYQFFFNTVKHVGNYDTAKLGIKVVGQGITALVMLVLCFVALFFSKKSSFVTMCTGLVLVATSILFFTMSKASLKCYPGFVIIDGHPAIGWIAYFLGGLLVIAGGLVVYKSILMMKDEIKHPSKPKGPSYNYLKK